MRPQTLFAGVIASFLCWAFIGAPAQAQDHQHEHAPAQTGINVFDVIKTLGIVTFSLLVATALAGLFMRKKRKILFPIHKALAVLTLLSGAVHGSLVLYFF